MMEKKEYPFEFSVVMAVYNVEPFLREAVDSLIEQDFGFEKIQLIMVDDGSTDGSGAICDEYAARYPENVLVIHKENGGVSSARNAGLTKIRGRFVSFMDPDDKLSENTMSAVFDFFSTHEQEVDLATIPLYYFDAQEGPHPLNNKFNQGTRVIDLTISFSVMHMSMATAFVTHEVARDIIRFDERLAIAEDAKMAAKILLRKQRLGVVAEGIYYYRKRSQGEASSIQGAVKSKKFYIDSVKHYTLDVLRYCQKELGYVPNFIQYSVFSDLQWKLRIKGLPHEILSETELEEYLSLLAESLQYIDDDIIMRLPDLSKEHKHFILSFKYHTPLWEKQLKDDILYYYQNVNVNYLSQLFTYIDFCEIKAGRFEVEGYMTSPGRTAQHTMEPVALVNGQWVECERVERDASLTALEQTYILATPFRLSLPLTEGKYTVELYCRVDGHDVKRSNLTFGKFAALGREYPHAHTANGGYVARFHLGPVQFSVERKSLPGRLALKALFLLDLCRRKRPSDLKALGARLSSALVRPFLRREIWLISDRPEMAGDNGEAFFRYLVEQKPRGVKPVFVLNSDAKEYAQLKELGMVIPFRSWRHKFVYLLSTKVISSQGDEMGFNPFYHWFRPYRDIIAKKKYIFLQHGIILHDLHQWLSRYMQNLALLVTSSPRERESVLQGAYHYAADTVALTGLPRYDLLRDEREKVITIMPTWRSPLVQQGNGLTGLRQPAANFTSSTYFSMYSELLNSKRFLDAAERLGYQIQYMSHPNMVLADELLPRDPRVKTVTGETSYREIFARSSLVVTDFSSVAFDFAYLRKPVLYYQTDAEEIFSGAHTYTKGYFDYETDGFGEAEYSADALVDRVIEYMEHGCGLKEKYRERIDRFFAFHDQNNCQRVYEKIEELD